MFEYTDGFCVNSKDILLFLLAIFSSIQEVFIPLQSMLTKPRNEGIMPGVTR